MARPDDENSLRSVIRQEVDAMGDGDVSMLLDTLGDDAVMMPPGDSERRGSELRLWLSEFVEQFAIEIHSYLERELKIEGDFGFDRYAIDWTVTPRAGGESVHASLKGVHVLRRNPAGKWKIALEIWNSDPSPAGAE